MSWRAAAVWCVLGAAAAAAAELVFHAPAVRVQHEPAPDRPVGSGRSQWTGKRALPDDPGRHRGDELPYVEYFVEHEVSAADARRAASALRVEDIREHVPGCGECTRQEKAYCQWQVVADHCCCERRYQESYPWVPHTCYAGPKPCTPIARSCSFYRRLRDCCCDRKLAEKWKNILSSSHPSKPGTTLTIISVILAVILAL